MLVEKTVIRPRVLQSSPLSSEIPNYLQTSFPTIPSYSTLRSSYTSLYSSKTTNGGDPTNSSIFYPLHPNTNYLTTSLSYSPSSPD